MKWTVKMQDRLMGVCLVEERDMGYLRVKDLVWRDSRLYAVVREWEEDEEGNVVEHEEPEAILRRIPVIAGYEHVVLKLINGRDPNELLFPESHPLPYGQALYTLERRYAARLYEMLSGCPPPVDNRRPGLSHADVDLEQYDIAAVYVVAQVLGRVLYPPGDVVLEYISRRSHRPRRERKRAPLSSVLGPVDTRES
jgi:hypothetical protein